METLAQETGMSVATAPQHLQVLRSAHLVEVRREGAHPNWRASAVGVYRLWRDSGYALGAVLAGVLADLFSVSWAIGVIAGLTFLSGVLAQTVMAETLPRLQHTRLKD